MRIFLLNPNFSLEKGNLMNVRKRQPLSLATIASLLRREHEVKLLDANVLGLNLKEILQAIKDFAPQILILTSSPVDRWECPNSNIKNIFKIINRTQVEYKILTGSHGTTSPDWIFEKCKVNFIVRGEPETITQKLVKEICSTQKFKNIRGISYFKEKKIINNPNAERIENLDNLPLPAYDLLPMEKYSSVGFKKPFSIMLTSRGCPYNCTYCLKCMAADKYITQSPERIISEIEHLIKNFNIKSIYFQDWEFCLNISRVEKICQLILDKKLKFEWGCNARADDILRSSKMLNLMKQAGCKKINLGLESASDKILQNINKKISADILQKAINTLKQKQIQVGYYMLLNCPGEDKKTIQNTVDFILKNNLKVKKFNLPIPYPETRLFAELNKKISWDKIEKYSGKIKTKFHPWLAKLYLRHYKFKKLYGKFYLLKLKFWKNFFKRI